MARVHARTKGKSRSKQPLVADMSFVTMKPKDVEKIILEKAKQGEKPSSIGLELRDSHGVPNVKKLCGKSISQMLEEAGYLKVPEDLANLVEKAKKLKKHLDLNSRDVHNKRGLLLIESRIRRLVKYYKRTGKIAQNWSYSY